MWFDKVCHGPGFGVTGFRSAWGLTHYGVCGL